MNTQHATDINMAADIANNKKSVIKTLNDDLAYMTLRNKEDSKYDAVPPDRPVTILQGFANYKSDTLALITVASLLVFAIIIRS